jgi:hypothetical protein
MTAAPAEGKEPNYSFAARPPALMDKHPRRSAGIFGVASRHHHEKWSISRPGAAGL